MLLASLSGCMTRKNPDESGSDAPISIEESELNPGDTLKGSLKIAVPDTTSHTNAINALVASFNEKFPDVTVSVTKFDMGNYKSKISTSASSAEALKKYETMYDVFWLAQDYINEWYDLGILGNLQNLMDTDASIDSGDLMTAAIECSSVNGNLYMMPRDYNQVVMYYNKDMFDAAGVDYPTSAMSAEDFKIMCEDLRDGLKNSNEKNDYGMRYKDVVANIIDCNIKWDSLCWPLLKSFGASVVNENGEVTFDSEETLNAIKYWKSFTDDTNAGIRLAIKIENGGTNPGVQFRMQQAPVYFQARAVMTDIVTETTLAGQTYHAIKNLGVCALPYFGDTYTVGGGCSGYAMYNNSVNSVAAWQFLKHVVSVEGQNAYSETGDCVPVLTSLLYDENAAWRHCLSDVLPSDFNHGAYVEHMEAYASTRDFYKYIPFAAQAPVLASIEETFNECSPAVGANADAQMRSTIAGKAADMTAKINQAKK